MLGHTSVITTGVYARIVDRSCRHAVLPRGDFPGMPGRWRSAARCSFEIAENPAQYLEEPIGLSQAKHPFVRS
jgi:hypothetical protein